MPLYEHTVIARPDLSNQQAQDLSTAFGEVITAVPSRLTSAIG